MPLCDFVKDDGTEEAKVVRKALHLLELDPRMGDVLPVVDQLPALAAAAQQFGLLQLDGPFGQQNAQDVGAILSAISSAWTTAAGEVRA